MAFSTPITNKLKRLLSEPYITCRINFCDKDITVITLVVWENAAARQEFPTIPDCILEGLQFPTNLALQSNNPIEYGYKLLEASGAYPNAEWNI